MKWSQAAAELFGKHWRKDRGASPDGDRAGHEPSPVPGLGHSVAIPSAGEDGSGDLRWTPHTVRVWQSWTCGRFHAFKTNFYGEWHLSDDGGKTSIFSDEYLQNVMAQAQAIEALRAASTFEPIAQNHCHGCGCAPSETLAMIDGVCAECAKGPRDD